jgi:iron complex outermembrane receptor protein
MYNAGEALDFVPGVRIIRSGTVGASNGVSIRSLNGGPSSNKTLVLLDGRPINDAWAGGVNFHSIPTELIDRIEVVRGPGSALYGSQASGGVINVFTKNPARVFTGGLRPVTSSMLPGISRTLRRWLRAR